MPGSILQVSFHYPPVQASSGLLRTLAFSRHLAEFGWSVSVLTADIIGQDSHYQENLNLIPSEVRVIRAKALDAARSLSVAGRYPGFLEYPDRFSSWIVSATVAGYLEVRKRDIQYILSTYPIASAHLIGLFLAKLSGKPWLADFRDPMVMQGHPDTKLRRRAHSWVEKLAIANCTIALFTNERAKRHYAQKFKDVDARKFHVIANGFDEEIFQRAESLTGHSLHARQESGGRPITILHSGTLYPNHRDLTSLFSAIAELAPQWERDGIEINFKLRASGYEQHYQSLAEKAGIQNIIRLEPAIPYARSIAEMLSSDALLLVQGASCNDQVPAKLYEYIRSGCPIFAMTDERGATAEVLRTAGLRVNSDVDDSTKIKESLSKFVNDLVKGVAVNCSRDPESTAAFSRFAQSTELHQLLCEMQVNLDGT